MSFKKEPRKCWWQKKEYNKTNALAQKKTSSFPDSVWYPSVDEEFEKELESLRPKGAWKSNPVCCGYDANGQPPKVTISNGKGSQCRHCLEFIGKGKEMLVFSFRHFPSLQPYAESGSIFIDKSKYIRRTDSPINVRYLQYLWSQTLLQR